MLDAPAFVAVIDGSELRERPSPTFAHHLEGLASVDVSRHGLVSSSITTRGFNEPFGGSLLMLQDHRPSALPALRANVPLLFTTTFEDVDHIEVLSGPASALYGPNAADGVLHVVTKSPFESPGTVVSLEAGTPALARGAFRHAAQRSRTVAYKISGEYLLGRDYAYLDPAEPLSFPDVAPLLRAGDRNKRNRDVRRAVAEARLDLRPTATSELVSTYGVAHVGTALDYVADDGALQMRDWTSYNFQQRARIGRFSAQAFANFDRSGNEDAASVDGSYLLRSGRSLVDRSFVMGAQVQHALSVGDRHDLTYGLDVDRVHASTENAAHGRNEDDDHVDELGAYLQSTVRPGERLDVIGGVRLDYNSRISGAQISPRIGTVFKPAANHSLRVTFNRAFVTPPSQAWFADFPGFDSEGDYRIRTLGNPPKHGWRFNRSCGGDTGLCMTRSDDSTWVAAQASAYYGTVAATEHEAIVAFLTPEFSQQQLPASLARKVADTVRALVPSSEDVRTLLRYPGEITGIALSELQDIPPLGASYSRTYEIGYQGVLARRLRVSADFWTERRNNPITRVTMATPFVALDKASLTRFLTPPLEKVFRDAGLPPTYAAAEAAAIAAAVAGRLARFPIGVVGFVGAPTAGEPEVYRTYVNSGTPVTLNGVDVAFDYAVGSGTTLSGSYRWVSDRVFPETMGDNSRAIALNAPDHRAILGIRYRNPVRGWGADVRGRYFNGYPVNAGLFATSANFFGPDARTRFTYEPIFATSTVDVGVHWLGTNGRSTRTTWSLYTENLLNHPYRTLPATPRIGRMVTTRLRYVF